VIYLTRVALCGVLLNSWPPPSLSAQAWPTPDGPPLSRHQEASAQCASDTPALSPTGRIGPVRVGASLADVLDVCDELERGWLSLEGAPHPALLLGLGDASVLLEMSDTTTSATILRMSTASEAVRTPDGMGPGLTVKEAAEIWTDLEVVFGEGTFLRSSSHPRFSLAISMGEAWDANAAVRARDQRDLTLLPERTHVAWLLILG
jgi:hypothetical protein